MFYSGRIASHVLLVLLLALVLLGSGRSTPAVAQPEETEGQTEESEADNARDADPNVYPIGVYITSMYDFDPVEGTAGMDYWVWSVHPPGLDPLENLEFFNAEEAETDLNLSEERGNEVWSQRKISAVTRHDWDLSNFPFDKQTLEIHLEEGIADTSTLLYEADTANSGYNEDMRLDGWRITDFEVQERSVNYDTTFGDPDISGGSSYARLVVLIEIERDSFGGFFKLVAGVYAALAISLVSFLMVSEIPPIFSGRMILLIGSVFSTIVNMQVSEAALGRPEYLSLVSKIHVAALIFIFAAAMVAILSRRTSDSGKPELANRHDRIWLVVFFAFYVLVNAALILTAAIG